MLDHLQFVSKNKSMLIAPAGFGKTHTIAECLNFTQDIGKQLILTHTHAGVASIREKIKKNGIPNSNYSVETITSFAQKYSLSFYTGNDIPDQENSEKYYPFILEKAISLFKLDSIKNIILNTYGGLFVDEYQDCTILQHNLILLISDVIPTHIIGDPLQGIFGFKGEILVDMNNPSEMKEFSESIYKLDKPQRWLSGNNPKLGDDLKDIRNVLENKQELDLKKYKSIEVHICNDIYKEMSKTIFELLKNENSILILDPISTNKNSRIFFVKRFNNIPQLIESIDDKAFYKLAKEADLITENNILDKIIYLSKEFFNNTGFDNWFNEKGIKNKRKDEEKLIVSPIKSKLVNLENEFSLSLFSELLKNIKNLPKIKCYRRELFITFCQALEEAEYENLSVFEAMINKRNLTRKIGRKVYGKCIGTTLLTKGLEFDTVAIVNAHEFNCPKHLYVALTRASKRLIVFTNNSTLKPNY